MKDEFSETAGKKQRLQDFKGSDGNLTITIEAVLPPDNNLETLSCLCLPTGLLALVPVDPISRGVCVCARAPAADRHELKDNVCVRCVCVRVKC